MYFIQTYPELWRTYTCSYLLNLIFSILKKKYSLFLLLYFDAKQQGLGLIYYIFHTKYFSVLHQYKL